MSKKQVEFNTTKSLKQPAFIPFSLDEEFSTELLTAIERESTLSPEKETPSLGRPGVKAGESLQTPAIIEDVASPIIAAKDLSASENNHSSDTSMRPSSITTQKNTNLEKRHSYV